MPINNSYSQTPKRIFTNKPFIKGMNYTNADLEPYVCRAVSNLELESSNSATKLRPGISNTAIGEEGEIAYRFYNKYVMFKYPINELLYNESMIYDVLSDNNGINGLRILDNNHNSLDFFDYIITNNTELEYNGELNISGGESGFSIKNNKITILALQMNEGDIPHCINNEDFSFVFLGVILDRTISIHKGLIKLYHHKAANKIIIEMIKPEQVDNADVNEYGVNLLSYSPSVYKDYIPFIEHDFYNDYMGVDKSKESKNTIDILTVALYKEMINPQPYENNNATMLKGVNATNPSQTNVYLRPYYVIPKGHYGAIVKASSKSGSEVCYNFYNDTFGLLSKTKKLVKETKTINMPVYSSTNSSNARAYNGALSEYNVVINKYSIPSFNLLTFKGVRNESAELVSSALMDTGNTYNEFHVGFKKETYELFINKYQLSAVSDDVSSLPIQHTYGTLNNNTYTITPTEYKKMTFNDCTAPNKHLTLLCEAGQFDKYELDLGGFYSVQDVGTRAQSYYELESIYSDLDNDDNFINFQKCRLTAHYKCMVYVYNRFNVSYTTVCTASDASDVLLANTTDLLEMPRRSAGTIFHKVTNTPTVQITEISSETLTNGTETVYRKCYELTTDVVYESDDDFVKDLINKNSRSLIYADADDPRNGNRVIDENIEYRYFSKICDIGDEVVYEHMLIPLDPPLSSVDIETPNVSFNFDISFTLSGNDASVQTSNTSPYNLDFSISINTTDLNDLNDEDTSLGYELQQTMHCEQSGVKISNGISVRHDNNHYDFDTNFTSLDKDALKNIILYGEADADAAVPISLYTTKESEFISKNYVHIVQDTDNSKHFSIPIKSTSLASVNGASISVELFPIIDIHTDEYTDESNNSVHDLFVEFEEEDSVTKPLYTIRTDIDSIVDMSEIINDKFKTTALRMCNHLGHLVVYGDETNSNSLYYSAYNNISYFPSNYVITFDNPIVYAYPHKSNLVVFTTEDVYLLYGGTVPSTTSTDGTEIAFTQKLIQANTRLGKDHINTVRTIGKDIFFINNNNKGYLLKTNKYVNDDSDVYLVKVTSQIDDLLDNPYSFARERFNKWNQINYLDASSEPNKYKQNKLKEYDMIVTGTVKHYFDISGMTATTIIVENSTINVIDGDTVDINGIRYRLADIDAPEITGGKNERLGDLAKRKLKSMLTYPDTYLTQLIVYDTMYIDNYGRHIAYILRNASDETYFISAAAYYNCYINVNASMLLSGLANFFDEDHNRMAHRISKEAYIYAKHNKIGIHNNIDYDGFYIGYDYVLYPGGENYHNGIQKSHISTPWINDTCNIYVYANNSYIYIFQPIHLDFLKTITLVYIYNIDSKIWTMYDILGYINPTDIFADNNILGFSILNSNDTDYTLPSILSFTKNKYDVNNVQFYYQDRNIYKVNISTDNYVFPINVYFDSGNQSISLMNEKLFREIKLSLGALPESLLTMDYEIDLYVDGKLVIPNQIASCGNHIHQVPINKHYKGREENLDGFRKVTFFTPARGRIPRIVFSITSETDINILEYAIVYMQLNAK